MELIPIHFFLGGKSPYPLQVLPCIATSNLQQKQLGLSIQDMNIAHENRTLTKRNTKNTLSLNCIDHYSKAHSPGFRNITHTSNQLLPWTLTFLAHICICGLDI
jgi:hypothetical protein